MARSYISYDLNGNLTSLIITDTPFPIDYDVESPTPQNELAKVTRDFHVAETPGLIGFYTFDCACPYVKGEFCPCSATAQKMKYYENGALVDKPAVTIKIDGATHTELVANKPPGSWVNIKLEAAAPDGTQITFKLSGATLSLDAPVFTFDNGSTNSVLLKSPAQGMIGHIHGMDKYLPPITISVRGWA